MSPPVEFILLWLAALALSAGVLTAASIRYAHWRGMLDREGQRRSHSGAVPRGGGIAVVFALLLGCALLSGGQWLDGGLLWRFAAAVALVAAVGWLDDHRPQSIRSRLLVHALAAALLVSSWWPGLPLWWLALSWVGLLAAINFWNFMDGINGIASLQAMFVAALLAHAFAAAGEAGLMLLSLALTAACAGFLPFNFPLARCFLGDVGSGAIGIAIGSLLLIAVRHGALDVWSALLLPLAFWLDAGLTLANRILLGRRWYTAHREHLYQWLVRRGRSHAQVATLFLGWNLAVVMPAYLLIQSGQVPSAAALAIVAALGVLLWTLGRRWVLRSARYYGFD